jgi:hypothetical protein
MEVSARTLESIFEIANDAESITATKKTPTESFKLDGDGGGNNGAVLMDSSKDLFISSHYPKFLSYFKYNTAKLFISFNSRTLYYLSINKWILLYALHRSVLTPAALQKENAELKAKPKETPKTRQALQSAACQQNSLHPS